MLLFVVVAVAVPAVVVCGDAVGEGGEEFPNSIYTTPDRPPQRLLLVIIIININNVR